MFYKDDDLRFFKPDPGLRELMILSHLAKEPDTSQAQLSKYLGISVSMVNKYIARFSEDEIINISGTTNRDTKYIVTVKGHEKRRRLLVNYMIETVRLYKDAKREFKDKFTDFVAKGVSKVVFYGAGETAEIAITAAIDAGMKVIAVVDQKKEKQGKTINGILIVSPSMLGNMEFDGIIISSLGYTEEIHKKIIRHEKQGRKIIKL